MLVLAIAIVAVRKYRDVPAIVWPSIAAFILVLVQAGIGAAVVAKELPAGLVAVHLFLATSLLTLVLVITVATFALQRPLRQVAVTHSFGSLALATSATVLALLLLGSFVAGSHYGLACNGWPLCNGEPFPSHAVESVQLNYMHRLLAGVVGLQLLALVVIAWRGRDKLA